MEDDPREVDWAPNQIKMLRAAVANLTKGIDGTKALRTAVNELQSAVASIRSQQDFMIGEGHGEPFEVWCRRKINGLTRGYEIHGERLDGLDKADARKGDRMSRFAETIDEMGDRLSAVEDYIRRLDMQAQESAHESGPPFIEDDRSMKVETSEQIDERRRVLVESMKDRRITFDPAPERKLIGPPHAHLDAPCTEACYEPVNTESVPPAGWVRQEDGCWSSPVTVVLNQAEVRVRDYMANHFSTATIEGVVRAVRGVVSEDDLPKSSWLDRRDVNEREARVVATACPGFGQCYAAEQLHWHDAHGVVHDGNR